MKKLAFLIATICFVLSINTSAAAEASSKNTSGDILVDQDGYPIVAGGVYLINAPKFNKNWTVSKKGGNGEDFFYSYLAEGNDYYAYKINIKESEFSFAEHGTPVKSGDNVVFWEQVKVGDNDYKPNNPKGYSSSQPFALSYSQKPLFDINSDGDSVAVEPYDNEMDKYEFNIIKATYEGKSHNNLMHILHKKKFMGYSSEPERRMYLYNGSPDNRKSASFGFKSVLPISANTIKVIDKGQGKLIFKKEGNSLRVTAVKGGDGISKNNKNWAVIVGGKKVETFNERTPVANIADSINKANYKGEDLLIIEGEGDLIQIKEVQKSEHDGKLTFFQLGDQLVVTNENGGYGIGEEYKEWSIYADGKKVASFNEKTPTINVKDKINNMKIKGSKFVITDTEKLELIDDGTYQIVSALNNTSVVDWNESNNNVILWKNNKANNQKWKFEYNKTKNAYQIKSLGKDDLVLTWANNKNVVAEANKEEDRQYWVLTNAGNDYFYLKNKQDSTYLLDVKSSGTVDGTDIQGWTFNGSDAQKFKLVKFGWQTINDKKYYYENGEMVMGWKEIDGKQYYFSKPGDKTGLKDGEMAVGDKTIDGTPYYFGGITEGSSGLSYGEMAMDWRKVNGRMYYYSKPGDKTGLKDGEMAMDFRKIDGKKYYFSKPGDKTGLKDGEMAIGWKIINGKKYYFGTSGDDASVLELGKMAIGWLVINGKMYYFNEDGVMPVVALFEHGDFKGKVKFLYESNKFLSDFNDITSSVIVFDDDFVVRLYENADYNDQLGEEISSYKQLKLVGLYSNDKISSVLIEKK